MKIIVTVVGEDRVGIIAKVCTYLSETQINIIDINQTIMDGYFTMMVVADASKANKDFDTFSKELDELGKSMNLSITVQNTKIFSAMHRI